MVLDNVMGVRYEVLIAVIITVLIRLIVYFYKNSKRNYPPGPWCLPIIGYLQFFSKNVHLQFIKFTKKYGDVFSIRLGSKMVVILNDPVIIKEAFAKQELVGKSPNSSFDVYGNKKPFRLNDTHDMYIWTEHRKFLLTALKDHSKIEVVVQEELKDFKELLRSYKGQPVDLAALFLTSLSNNINSLIFGQKYSYDDPLRQAIDKDLEQLSKIIIKDDPLTFFPWVKHVPFFLKWLGIEKYYNMSKVCEKIFRKRVDEHKETLDKDNLRDFVDSYLVEMEPERKQRKDAKTSLIDDTLFQILPGLLIAGFETGGASLGWIMYTMAAFPDIQKKVQDEIFEVVGKERHPEYEDKKSLPYTHAVMLEVMRWQSVVPLNAARYTLGDTKVAGYDIPSGTLVMANFWAVHHDPRYWQDPDEFRPERFLSADKKSIEKPPYFMPFSTGKRACPGKSVANLEVFLYFVTLLQKFDVRFPDGYKPTFDGDLPVFYIPPPVKIRFLAKN